MPEKKSDIGTEFARYLNGMNLKLFGWVISQTNCIVGFFNNWIKTRRWNLDKTFFTYRSVCENVIVLALVLVAMATPISMLSQNFTKQNLSNLKYLKFQGPIDSIYMQEQSIVENSLRILEGQDCNDTSIRV